MPWIALHFIGGRLDLSITLSLFGGSERFRPRNAFGRCVDIDIDIDLVRLFICPERDASDDRIPITILGFGIAARELVGGIE